MGIVLSKNLKQKQSLKLTPTLKKSIDLLQLSRFELIKKIEKEIEDNPFLEKKEDIDNVDGIYDKDFNFDIESKLTLRESLIKQLDDFQLTNKQIELSNILINSIDECGKLAEETYEIEKISKYNFEPDEIEKTIKGVIQKMSPPGIGHRNYKECIKIQINSRDLSSKKKGLIMEILFNENLDNLDEIKRKSLFKGISEENFNDALNEIKKCDLSPGLNFEKVRFIEPDLKISINEKNLRIDFIEATFPIIKVDEDLITNVKKEIRSKGNPKLLEKINEAKWLLTSVQKRNDTVKKVGEYICSKQFAFFENNPLKINTLNNKEIASEIGVHPSTVSRILRHKYIETPKGIIPFKSLLVSSVSKIRGISDLQLMKLIKDIIDSEKNPKSDKKIAIELNKKGYGLARRTITKYRKKNNIPSSRYR
tara:strand:+ start:571 stop:1839 length:1269 start_codon:yes stop_codon:yes gene_type:complete